MEGRGGVFIGLMVYCLSRFVLVLVFKDIGPCSVVYILTGTAGAVSWKLEMK